MEYRNHKLLRPHVNKPTKRHSKFCETKTVPHSSSFLAISLLHSVMNGRPHLIHNLLFSRCSGLVYSIGLVTERLRVRLTPGPLQATLSKLLTYRVLRRLCIVRCYSFDPSVAPIGAVGGRRWTGRPRDVRRSSRAVYT